MSLLEDAKRIPTNATPGKDLRHNTEFQDLAVAWVRDEVTHGQVMQVLRNRFNLTSFPSSTMASAIRTSLGLGRYEIRARKKSTNNT